MKDIAVRISIMAIGALLVLLSSLLGIVGGAYAHHLLTGIPVDAPMASVAAPQKLLAVLLMGYGAVVAGLGSLFAVLFPLFFCLPDSVVALSSNAKQASFNRLMSHWYGRNMLRLSRIYRRKA